MNPMMQKATMLNVETIKLKTLEEWAIKNKAILPQRIQNYIFSF